MTNPRTEENYSDALDVLQDMDTDNELTPQGILDAIVGGRIPHVVLKGFEK